jgi:hypothetical protein
MILIILQTANIIKLYELYIKTIPRQESVCSEKHRINNKTQ